MTETVVQEMTDNRALPEVWALADLGDLLDIVRGISFPSAAKRFEPEDGYIACLRTTNVQRDVEWENLWFVPEEYLKRDEQLVKPLDILISTANSFELVGKVAQVHQMPVKATLGAFISLIRVPSQLDAKYFYFLLSSGETQARIRKLASTTTNISNVSTKKLRALTLRVPPLNEQRRIVEKIEELFAKLDAGVRSLEQVRTQLKSYRRSVLKAAVEGELSREWREAHRDELEPASELLKRILQERREKFAGKKYKEPASPDTSELPKLPDRWEWVKTATLSELNSNAICAGPFGTIFKARDFRPSGIPIIFLRHVGEGEYLTHKPGFMDAGKWKELFQSYSVYGGELLVTKLGDPPGVCAIYPDGIGPAMVTPDVIKMSVDNRIANSRFLMHYYNSDVARRFAFGVAFGTTRLRMTLPIFREISVPLPPLEEQRFIVEEVERRLSVVDKLEATVEENLKQAGGLRQSILKQAFSGELVPQDPDDEPASALLERIREERQAAKPKAGKKSVRSKRKDPADDWVPELFPEQGA